MYENELATMADSIEKVMNDIMAVYRTCATRSTELRRKMDTCEAVTKDIM